MTARAARFARNLAAAAGLFGALALVPSAATADAPPANGQSGTTFSTRLSAACAST